MNHFDYRDGVLHAEDVPFRDIAAAVGTPFYCYSTATLTRHYNVFAKAFAGLDALVCYAMKANSNQAVLRAAGKARRRRRRGVGRRDAPRARRRHPGRTRSCFRASARRRAKWISRSPPASSASTSSPSRNSNCCRRARAARAGRRRSRCASIPMSTPGPTGRSRPARPRTSSAFPGSAPAMSTPARRELPGIRVAGIDMHIGSQITDLQPFDDAFALLAELVGDAARRRPCDRACRSRRRPRHPLPHRQRSAAAARRLCARSSRSTSRSSG